MVQQTGGVALPFLHGPSTSGASASASTSTANSVPPVFDIRFAKFIGDQVGIVDASPVVCHAVIEEVGHHLRAIVRQASRFAMHGRRARITPEDVTNALKHCGVELPLDMRMRYELPLRSVMLNNDERVFTREDAEEDLANIINAPLPKLPAALHLRASYLVYNGVYQLKRQEDEKMEGGEEDASQEEEAGRLEKTAKRRRKTPGVALHCRHSLRELPTKERVFIRPQTTESLSVEQQIYFKEVVETCMGTDDKRRTEALRSLETDPGVQALISHFARLIVDSIHINVVQKSLSMLIYMVRVTRAISNNKSVKLESVLHDLVPALISCMVGKVLCIRPESDNHWALRDFSSKTLISLIRTHGNEDVRKRVLAVLKKVFERRTSFAVVYGCVQALYEMSTDQERAEMYPLWREVMQQSRPDVLYQTATALDRTEGSRLNLLLQKMEPLLRRAVDRVNERRQIRGF